MSGDGRDISTKTTSLKFGPQLLRLMLLQQLNRADKNKSFKLLLMMMFGGWSD